MRAIRTATHSHSPTPTHPIVQLADIQTTADPEGLRAFYYLVADLKTLVFGLMVRG